MIFNSCQRFQETTTAYNKGSVLLLLLLLLLFVCGQKRIQRCQSNFYV